jgi:hypothetical protein
VDGFVTAGGPAGSLREAIGVIRISNKNSTVDLLLLEVAFQAEGGAALG